MKENSSKIINKEYDSQILLTILQRNWWWPVFFIFVFASIAFFYLRYTKSVYESQMVIQLGNKDQAKEVMDIEHIGAKPQDLSSDIEWLRSQMLFEKALDKLNINTTIFAKGSILTEELYRSGLINVMPYELKDSSLIDIPIYIVLEGNNIRLNYFQNGNKYSSLVNINKRFKNSHFDIIINVPDLSALLNSMKVNEYYFVFNSLHSLSSRLFPGL